MELKEFISEALVKIQEGVQDAITRRSFIKGSAGAISPVFGPSMDAVGMDHVHKVEFDVAVTVTDKIGSGGKAGIKVWGLELGGEGSKSAEQSTVSRIKFAIPTIPPAQHIMPENADYG